MNNKIVIIIFVFSAFLMAGSKIAVATKVTGNAEFQRGTEEQDFSQLKPGTVLEDGDKVKTGANGFAAVIFIDDKSTLKIRGNSEVQINGQRSATSISKKINMETGTVRAKINDQKKSEFVIQTPTSVASVKGTDFWFVSDLATGDQLFGLEGNVLFTNILSGMSMDVTAGLTCVSGHDGSMDMGATNPSDVPVDPDETDGGQSSQMEIQFEDEDGNTKTLIIEYQ
ncbi:MAG: FecR domain-containing protein [Candidatus Marinimicrobia bacterium]|nr:FecR domain-containing protein [Candidatus Neomarinimicrobiota bacterium]